MPDFNIYVAQGKDGADLKKVGEAEGRTRGDALNVYLNDNPREKRLEFTLIAKANIGVLEVGEEPPKPPRRKITVKGTAKKGGTRRKASAGTASKSGTAKKSTSSTSSRSRSRSRSRTSGGSSGGKRKSPFKR